MTELKFENTAVVGDTIIAYDFEPMEGRGDSYIVGRVVAKGWIDLQVSPDHLVKNAYQAFTIVAECVVRGGAKAENASILGEEVFVPFESSCDWDGRVGNLKDGI